MAQMDSDLSTQFDKKLSQTLKQIDLKSERSGKGDDYQQSAIKTSKTIKPTAKRQITRKDTDDDYGLKDTNNKPNFSPLKATNRSGIPGTSSK